MTAPRRRWSFSLRTLFVVVTVLAVFVGFMAWHVEVFRKTNRDWIENCIVNGMLTNPESLRGDGLFSDTELDALIAERERRAATQADQPK